MINNTSPYLGLRPYREDEQGKFYGRDDECALLVNKLLTHRLTLLFAASGVGKSSLLNAAVIPELTAKTGKQHVVVYHNDWVTDPLQGLHHAIEQQLAPHTATAPTNETLAAHLYHYQDDYPHPLILYKNGRTALLTNCLFTIVGTESAMILPIKAVLLGGDAYIRASTVEALATFTSSEVIPLLITLLTDKNEEIQEAAATVLKKHQAAIQLLLSKKSLNNSVQNWMRINPLTQLTPMQKALPALPPSKGSHC